MRGTLEDDTDPLKLGDRVHPALVISLNFVNTKLQSFAKPWTSQNGERSFYHAAVEYGY